MSTKRGRPTNRAVAERRRRAKARYQSALAQSVAAADALFAAAEIAVYRKGKPDWPQAKHNLEQAAYAFTRATDEAGEAFV